MLDIIISIVLCVNICLKVNSWKSFCSLYSFCWGSPSRVCKCVTLCWGPINTTSGIFVSGLVWTLSSLIIDAECVARHFYNNELQEALLGSDCQLISWTIIKITLDKLMKIFSIKPNPKNLSWRVLTHNLTLFYFVSIWYLTFFFGARTKVRMD